MPVIPAASVIPEDAPCVEQCVPAGMLWPVLIALYLEAASMPLDTNALMNSARCIDQCIPKGMQLPVLIWIAATAAGESTDPNTLMDNAKCVGNCVPEGMQLPVLIGLTTGGSTPTECVNLQGAGAPT